MNQPVTVWSLILCGFLFASSFQAVADNPPVVADVILTNGKVWTVDPAKPEVEAVAVWHGRILTVGNNDQIQKLVGPRTHVVDLKGRRVVPGFYDSHVHLLGSGLRLSEVALKDAKDEAEFGTRKEQLEKLLEKIRVELFFVDYAPIIAISALKGEGMTRLFKLIEHIRKLEKAGCVQTALTTYHQPLTTYNFIPHVCATRSAPKL